MKKIWKIILIFAGLAIFLAALYLLSNQLKTINPQDIKNSLQSISAHKIALAMALALLYYLLLGGYDIIAFKHINNQAPIKPKEIFFTCFLSNAIGNNTGYSMLFGGSLRYRLYSIYKLSMIDVTKVLFFSSATIWLGLFAAGGFIFVIDPVSLAGVTKYNITTRSIGFVFLAILCAYTLLSALNLKPITICKKSISFPNIKIAAMQILLATADWITASLALFALMPFGEIPYFVLLKVFLVAQLLGIISQVPGGMGVFETAIAMLLPNAAANPSVIGGLLAYRVIFYFFPLSIALLTLGFYEIARLIKKVDEKTRMLGKALSSVIVQILAISTFLAGMIAVFSASTPFDIVQLKKILSLIPVWLLNLSNFVLSITAAGLFFISRALQLRAKKARKWGLIFTFSAIVLSLVLGEHPILLIYFILLFAALFASKKYFYRERRMLNIPFDILWVCAIGGIFAAAVWIGFFVNKQNVLMWIADPKIFIDILMDDGDASRFLRTAISISVLFIIVAIEQIFRKMFYKPAPFDNSDIENIINHSNYTYSLNALSGDKKFILSDDKDALIMYAAAGNNWFALSDPVGNRAQKRELIWKFKEAADAANMRISLIGIGHKYIDAYRDIGLDILTIAQEAKIVLKNFKAVDYFKNLSDSLEKQGFSHQIMERGFADYKDIFAKINNEWEKNSNYISRNFIPGDYNEEIIKNCSFAILKKNGAICGFSIIDAVKNKYEASCKIMRFVNCPDNIFEYMVYKTVLWAKEKEYTLFDLGLAYSKDDKKEPFLKYFTKMFALSEYRGHDFKALRDFKERFNPVWNNKYAAIHFDEHIIMFIKNFTTLISPVREKKNTRKFFKRFFVR
ncbi:MAG: phosphatidylglycerol lysyltransferase domain-containing protein [Elusimicrobiota bacterium]|jgi:phosphatidylglycerol lysyltransferase|nr:phosphatidylglycerol lysyltransferase domain-containing protein [Elusimicrobiota bacterium]